MAINQDITFLFINSLKNNVKLVTKKRKRKIRYNGPKILHLNNKYLNE